MEGGGGTGVDRTARGRYRIRRIVAILIVFGLCLGACDSAVPASAPPAPTGSTAAATPVPSTASSPAFNDVSARFETQITAASEGSLAISGSVEIGPKAGDVTGSLTYAGGHSSELMTVTAAGLATTTATIRVKGLEYKKMGDGPWLQDAVPPPAGSDLWTYLHGLAGVVDRGVEQHGGVAAHRIEPPANTALDAAALGLADPALVDRTVSVIFYADDDGRPMAIVVTMAWTQPVDGVATPATMTLELTYAGTAGGGAIAAPEHVWNRFTSGRFHFSVAYPDRWTTDTTDRYDDFLNGPGVTHVGGRRLRADGRSLASWTKTIVGIHGDSPKDYVLLGNDATTLAGDAARMLTSTYHDYGQKLICFEVLALHGARLYDIFWVSPITTRDAGLVTFRQMLSTYAYPLRG